MWYAVGAILLILLAFTGCAFVLAGRAEDEAEEVQRMIEGNE